MLSKVGVKGYQSLKNVELDLGLFTVITGESDSGKSAFIRALYGWSRNESGSGFISHGTSKTTVNVVFDDGRFVVWEKPKNSYKVVNGDDSREYSKAGRECPQEVQEFTGFIDVVFDVDHRDLINFAHQFDAPFLLTMPGTKIAKVIGKISGIEYVYNAQRLASKFLGVVRQEISTAKNILDSTEIKLRDFEDLDELVRKLDIVTKSLDKIKLALDKAESSSVFLKSIDETARGIEEITKQIDLYPDVEDLEPIRRSVEKAKSVVSYLDQIEDIQGDLLLLNEDVEERAQNIEEIDKELQEFFDGMDICPLCKLPTDRKHVLEHS